MRSRTACFGILGWLLCGTPGFSETFDQLKDKNGMIGFTNHLSPQTGLTEVRRAREQAEIEYWRAVEARARSQRNTPDTQVHRKRRSALQEGDLVLMEVPAKYQDRSRMTRKMSDEIADLGHQSLDVPEGKKMRAKKVKIRNQRKKSGIRTAG